MCNSKNYLRSIVLTAEELVIPVVLVLKKFDKSITHDEFDEIAKECNATTMSNNPYVGGGQGSGKITSVVYKQLKMEGKDDLAEEVSERITDINGNTPWNC